MGKRKQAQLPTIEDAKNERIAELAEAYVEARDERMARTRDEVGARDTLLHAMHEAGLTRYEDPDSGRVVVIEAKEKLRVKSGDDEGDDDDGDGEE